MSILNTSKTGIYKVTTLSGSIYPIDLDDSKGKRLPGVGAGALVADQDWFHIVSIDPLNLMNQCFCSAAVLTLMIGIPGAELPLN